MSKTVKIFILCIAFMATVVFSLSAKGDLRLGLEFGNPTAVVIIRPAPFDFRVGYNFAPDKENIFLSGDYRIISGHQLIDFLHLFLGVGIYTQVYFADRGDDQGQFDLGARLPFGLQAFLIKSTLELFVELAPTVEFLPTLQFNKFEGWHGYIGFTIRTPF